MPRYGLGGLTSGEGDDEEGSALPGAGGPNDKSSGESGNPNPFYKRLLKSLTAGAANVNAPASTSQPDDSASSAAGAGEGVAKGIKGLFGLAQGGTVGGKPHHFYGSHSKLKTPAIEMIKKPQIRQLGVQGADAVIPMIKRPQNKLGLKDLPNLVKKYGGKGARF